MLAADKEKWAPLKGNQVLPHTVLDVPYAVHRNTRLVQGVATSVCVFVCVFHVKPGEFCSQEPQRSRNQMIANERNYGLSDLASVMANVILKEICLQKKGSKIILHSPYDCTEYRTGLFNW